MRSSVGRRVIPVTGWELNATAEDGRYGSASAERRDSWMGWERTGRAIAVERVWGEGVESRSLKIDVRVAVEVVDSDPAAE